MEALECIKTRRSIRKFTEEPVSHEAIERIVDAAVYAPSWKNTQIARYVVVENPEIKDKIANDCVLDFTFNTKTIGRAAALVVVAYKKNRSGFEKDGSFSTSKGDRWEMFDAGIATQTFCLAAHEEGIGSVIMGIFDEDKVAEAISLPEDLQVAALIAIGHPAVSPEAPERKKVSDVLSYC